MLPNTLPDTPPTGDRGLTDNLTDPKNIKTKPIGSPFTLNPDSSNGQPVEYNPDSKTPEFTFERNSEEPGAPAQQSIVTTNTPEGLPAKSPVTSEVKPGGIQAPEGGRPNEIVAAEGAGQPSAENTENTVQDQIDGIKQEIRRQLGRHFIQVHLQAMDQFDDPFLGDSFFDVMHEWQDLSNKTITMPDGEERKLSDEEQQEIQQDSLDYVASFMLSIIDNQAPDNEPDNSDFQNTLSSFRNLLEFLNSKDSFDEDEVGDTVADHLQGNMNILHITRVASNMLFFNIYKQFGSQDADSAFQKMGERMRQTMESSPNADAYRKVYAESLRAFQRITDIVLSGDYQPNYGGSTAALKAFYDNVESSLSQGLNGEQTD